MSSYIPRELSSVFNKLLAQYPVVTLTGPRQSGKTTFLKNELPDYHYINLEDPDTRLIAQQDPRALLKFPASNRGLIIDEFQRVPELTSYIQGIVDKNKKAGEFVLSGSQQLEISQTVSQSLAGRTSILRLFPFTYSEIYKNKTESIQNLLYTGFMPRIFDSKLSPTEAYGSYINTYIERDVRQLTQIHLLKEFQLFLKLCASLIGQTINYSKISNDIGINHGTVKHWISILEASYIIFLLPPYFKNQKKRVIKQSKLYFYDVGLAAQLLGAKSEAHIKSLPNQGHLFENMIVADRIKKNAHLNLNKDYYFYRDNSGYEVDLLESRIEGPLAIEIKMGSTFTTDYLKNLNYFKKNNPKAELQLVYSGEQENTFKETTLFNFKNYLKK